MTTTINPATSENISGRSDLSNWVRKKVSNLGWHLKINDEYVTRFDTEELYDVSFGQKVSVPYSESRIPYNYGSSIDVDWDAIASAMALISVSKCQWMTKFISCLLYTSPSPRDGLLSRMPSSA